MNIDRLWLFLFLCVNCYFHLYSPRMICIVGHQLAPLDENRISGILGAGPGRAALFLLVALKRATSKKACAPRTRGYFLHETCFVAGGCPAQ
jgi:hypothetical protein